jgi:hypothetical protein
MSIESSQQHIYQLPYPLSTFGAYGYAELRTLRNYLDHHVMAKFTISDCPDKPQAHEHPRPRNYETSVQDLVLPSLKSWFPYEAEYAVLHWKPTIIPGCVEDRPDFLPLARCIKIELLDNEGGTAHRE